MVSVTHLHAHAVLSKSSRNTFDIGSEVNSYSTVTTKSRRTQEETCCHSLIYYLLSVHKRRHRCNIDTTLNAVCCTQEPFKIDSAPGRCSYFVFWHLLSLFLARRLDSKRTRTRCIDTKQHVLYYVLHDLRLICECTLHGAKAQSQARLNDKQQLLRRQGRPYDGHMCLASLDPMEKLLLKATPNTLSQHTRQNRACVCTVSNTDTESPDTKQTTRV